MDITVKQLRAFVAVARSRSFAEACGLLNLSQPALSVTIRNLEQAVGGRLLARTTRTLALTSARRPAATSRSPPSACWRTGVPLSTTCTTPLP